MVFHGHSLSDPRDLLIPFIGNSDPRCFRKRRFKEPRDANCPKRRLLVHVKCAPSTSYLAIMRESTSIPGDSAFLVTNPVGARFMQSAPMAYE